MNDWNGNRDESVLYYGSTEKARQAEKEIQEKIAEKEYDKQTENICQSTKTC